jgi:C4-dicarboxylate-specific signal transduction histidine kinase
VIINLLKNALESMDGALEGRLSITTAAREGLVELTVSDTGCGIRLDSMDKLFSPFFTTKIGGVGLGLSVSQRIVAQHGGRIEVDSRPGVGSRFTVTLAATSSDVGKVPDRTEAERGT